MEYFILLSWYSPKKIKKPKQMKVVPMLFYNVRGQPKQVRTHHAHLKGFCMMSMVTCMRTCHTAWNIFLYHYVILFMYLSLCIILYHCSLLEPSLVASRETKSRVWKAFKNSWWIMRTNWRTNISQVRRAITSHPAETVKWT